jgi:p21-activated kinase 1
MGNTWRSHGGTGTATAKGKKRILDILKFNKRPEISTLLDPPHITRVGFDSSTRKITGLSKYWKRLSPDSGISEPAQDKDLLAVMDIDKFYREGSGNVSDPMDPVPGSSRSAPIPGAAHADSGVSDDVTVRASPLPTATF